MWPIRTHRTTVYWQKVRRVVSERESMVNRPWQHADFHAVAIRGWGDSRALLTLSPCSGSPCTVLTGGFTGERWGLFCCVFAHAASASPWPAHRASASAPPAAAAAARPCARRRARPSVRESQWEGDTVSGDTVEGTQWETQ
jgi:hypothetical protein